MMLSTGVPLGADHRGLMRGGQPGAGEILHAAVGNPVVVQQDVAGQFFVFGPQAIRDPGADAGRRADAAAGVQQQVLLAVQRRFADHAADHAQFVGARGDVRQQIADPQSRLAALLELPQALQPLAAWTGALRTGVGFQLGRLAVPLGQLGLGIERVDVRNAAVHEQKDHVLGPRREMRARRPGFRRRPAAGQPGERQPAKAHARSLEKTAPRQRRRLASRAERIDRQPRQPRELPSLDINEFFRLKIACATSCQTGSQLHQAAGAPAP